MSEHNAKQATTPELHRGVREHYERVSRISTEFNSVVPRAIDFWFAQFGPSGETQRELYASKELGELLNKRDNLLAQIDQQTTEIAELCGQCSTLRTERDRLRGVVEAIAEMAGDGPAATMCRAALKQEAA